MPKPITLEQLEAMSPDQRKTLQQNAIALDTPAAREVIALLESNDLLKKPVVAKPTGATPRATKPRTSTPRASKARATKATSSETVAPVAAPTKQRLATHGRQR